MCIGQKTSSISCNPVGSHEGCSGTVHGSVLTSGGLAENGSMRTEQNHGVSDPQAREDYEARIRHVADGAPIGPQRARRIRERAERITEEIQRGHGDIDVVKLLHDAREDT